MCIRDRLKGDNQKLSQQMAENSKTMEEKMDELKRDSQKNMEVLNQKMAAVSYTHLVR